MTMTIESDGKEIYRDWLIELNWRDEYEATHPDFDPRPIWGEDHRFVKDTSIEGVRALVDEWIAENE